MATNLITLTIQDGNGELSPFSVYVTQDGADTVAEILTLYALPLWDALRPIINGVLVSAQVTVQADISEWDNNTITPISDIQEKALFHFFPSGGFRALTISIPTVLESIFTLSGAGFEVDMSNADVAVFTVLMTEDLGSGGINATDSHGTPLVRAGRGIQYFKG